MRSFRNFIKGLINAKENERSSREKSSSSHFDYACAKEHQSPLNVSHHRSRSHLAHHTGSRSTYPLHGNARSTSGVQRSSETNEVSVHPSSPHIPPVGAVGARRAPNLASAQPSRSPRPPFEESVRNTTRRTPGSEDATSVETEIGYPVVGPATSRAGHQTLTSTLYHQEAVAFSQDVSTNTPSTENYRTINGQQLQAFSDRPLPAPESTTIAEEVDVAQGPTEGQSNPIAVVPALRSSEIAMLPSEQSAMTNEEQQGVSQAISLQPSQANDDTSVVRPPTIGTDTSPFRPLPKGNETSSTQNQVSNSGSGRLPTNFYFPSQMRKNRSNLSHFPGHRRTASSSDERGDVESKTNSWCCTKLSRTNLSLSSCFHHDDAPAEHCSSRIADIQLDEPPVEIMIHSLHCPGDCKIDARLEDSHDTSNEACPTESLAVLAFNSLDMKNQCKESVLYPSLATKSEKLALNVMSCVSWSDLPSSLTVTDGFGKSVQNARVLIVPYKSPLYPPADKPPHQENLRVPHTDDRKSSEEFPSWINQLIPPSKSRAVPQHGALRTLPQQDSTVQTSFPVALYPTLNNSQSYGHSASLAPPSPYNDGKEDNTWAVKAPLRKHHSECISDDDSRESICDRWRSRPPCRLRRNVIDLNVSTKLINQACGPDSPLETTSIGICCSVRDLCDCNNSALSGKDEYFCRIVKNADVDRGYVHYPAESNQLPDDGNTCEAPPKVALLDKPLLVLTVPENDDKMNITDQENLELIDTENHLFVEKASKVSVASSVFIGDDGKAVVTGSEDPRLIALSVSESRQTLEDPCIPSTGAVPKRELGAKPKIRGDTLTIRKKMLGIDDSPARDRSSEMDDIPNLGARGHRVISERNRGRTRNQVSSKKNHLGIKEPQRSPGTWPRKTGSRRSFETSRRRCSEQPIDEVRSIWINPETERSSPSSNSTIDITADLNQAFVLSDKYKSSGSPQRTACPLPRPRPVFTLKSPKLVRAKTGGSAECGFECTVCRDHLKQATTQCKEGHRVCAQCLAQHDTCPICHSAVLSEPNKAIDKFAPTFAFSLKNNQTIYKETDENEKRESRSLYRPQTCPLANCSQIRCAWKGLRPGIRPHMKKCHGHSGKVHPFRSFFTVEAFVSNLWENRTYDVEVLFVDTEIFELHKVFDSRKSCMWGLLRNILAKDVSLRYTYSIKFQPQDIRGSVTFNCEVLGGAEELGKALERGKRFKFYLDSFSQEPLQFFSIQLKVIPKTSTMFRVL